MAISLGFLFNNPSFLLLMIGISLAIKTSLLTILVPQLFCTKTIFRINILLIALLVCPIFAEFAWAIKYSRLLFFPELPYSMVLFFIRIAWAIYVIQYQALGLFIETLTSPTTRINLFQKVILAVSSIIGIYYLYLAFFDFASTNEFERSIAGNTMSLNTNCFEITIMRHTTLYILPLLVIPSLYKALRAINQNHLPKILHHQFSVILRLLIIPYLLLNFLRGMHFESKFIKQYGDMLEGTTIVLSAAIVYYCIRKIMHLRFLNFTNHVSTPKNINFVNDFKAILEQLSMASTAQELAQLTGTFLKDSCGIALKKASLHLRMSNLSMQATTTLTASIVSQSTVEEHLTAHPELLNAIKLQKILIYDEVAFSNFYEKNDIRTQQLDFLKQIKADIFLPILEKQQIIAYIIVEENARPNKLYSSTERDEMIVFASYLSNVINLLQHRNFEALMAQEKELQEELYKKNQEITQYKESIRSFLKNGKQKAIGILFFKQRRFIFANQTAKEMVKININTQEGHPLTRALKQIAQHVQEYKSPQTILFKDSDSTRMVISGVLNLEHNNVIIILNYPDISDIISKQLSLLKDPSKWDYVLYLETTKPGQLINQLIPGSGEVLLNFKINLLQTALSKKATLLKMADEDLATTVELLHHISMRETLLTIVLSKSDTAPDIANKIFGINPIYGMQQNKPMLEKLNGTGTLALKNIEYLDPELQEYLAEFIRSGVYRPYKNDRKMHSDVRIICSSNASLHELVQEGKFSSRLYDELQKTCITFPSLELLPEEELHELTHGFTQQAVKVDDFKNLLELNDKEKTKLASNRPVSLHELKMKIQHVLQHKSKRNNIEQEIQFDPAYDITDPELIQACRLGKQALRDHKIMVMLWNKFKNQNKIATFLGVNRSSVNRRCKEYNLET